MNKRTSGGAAVAMTALVLAGAGVVSAVASPGEAAVQPEPTRVRTVADVLGDDAPDIRHRRRGVSVRPPSTPGRSRSAADLATLRVSVRDRLGAAPSSEHAGYALAFDQASGDLTVVELTDGEGKAEVPAGSYLVQAFVETAEAGGTSLSMPTSSVATVDGLATARLDARGTARVGASVVDRPDARLVAGTVQVTQPTAGRDIWYAADFDYPGGLYVQPTGPVKGLDLNVYTALSQNASSASPYLYHLTFEATNGIPSRPEFTTRTKELATVPVRIDGQNRSACGRIGARGRDPELAAGFGATVVVGDIPDTYRVYFTPGTDVVWTPYAAVLPPDCSESVGGDLFARQRSYPASGTYPLSFGRGPIGPTMTSANPAYPAAGRTGDELSFEIPMLADADSRHGGPTAFDFADYPYSTGSTTLARADGTVLGSVDRSGYGRFQVPAESTSYVLTTETTRTAPWSDLSTAQRIRWSFTSANSGTSGAATLPLLAVRYDLALDEWNRAPGGRPFTIALSVERNGSVTPPTVTSVTLAASFDDGKSWRQVGVSRAGDRWSGTLNPAAGNGYVSLRATAVDAAGNKVDQTVIRAYALAS